MSNDHPHTENPAERPAEPEHPMLLDGGSAPGDMALMARCMTEDLFQSGLSLQEVLEMSRDPNYQALFSMRVGLGDVRFEELVTGSAARVGRHRYRVNENTGTTQPVTLTVRRSS